MRHLITGGAGFIGSNYIRYILRAYPEDSVINLDALTYAGNLENLKDVERDPRYRFVKGDITDLGCVNELVPHVDVIEHFAAESHVDRSIMDPGVFVKTNVMGTQVLLNAAVEYQKRFHHVSTDEVFGSAPAEGFFTEATQYDPRSPYSASKAASDHLVRAYHHTFGLPITITNCCNNYGPYHFPEKVIPLFITNLLEGRKVPLYGDGLNVRDWIHVDDHNEAVDLVVRNGRIGETYCIGARCPKTNLELTEIILKKMGMGAEMIERVKDRPGHDRRYAIDPTKIETELGWKPRRTFEEGIEETIQWYKDHPDWWQRAKSGAYRTYYEQQYLKR
jgi:dTDP-glucose 4,6-dehydratase